MRTQDYAAFYERLTAWFRKDPSRIVHLNIANRIFTYSFYVLYPLLLIILLVRRDPDFLKALLVPAVSFVLVTLIRKMIDRKRPYERWQIDPLIHKDTKGNSCPSRHLFASSVIAMTFLYFNVPAGILLLVLSFIGGGIRVLGGVHYPSDILAGMACGIAAGIFLWLL